MNICPKNVVPTDFYIKDIFKQNVEGERCAIRRYEKLVKVTTVNSILADEIEHEDDLEDYLLRTKRRH